MAKAKPLHGVPRMPEDRNSTLFAGKKTNEMESIAQRTASDSRTRTKLSGLTKENNQYFSDFHQTWSSNARERNNGFGCLHGSPSSFEIHQSKLQRGTRCSRKPQKPFLLWDLWTQTRTDISQGTLHVLSRDRCFPENHETPREAAGLGQE